MSIRLHWLDRRVYPFVALPPELLQRIQGVGDHCDVTINKFQREQHPLCVQFGMQMQLCQAE